MSQVSEVKCLSCGEWSKSTNKMDETCPHCHQYLNPERVHYTETNRINAELNKKNSYLVINDQDDPLVQMFKGFVNWLRWTTFYGISVMFFIVGIIVILFGLAFL